MFDDHCFVFGMIHIQMFLKDKAIAKDYKYINIMCTIPDNTEGNYPHNHKIKLPLLFYF